MSALARIFRAIPAEVWALLFIAIPLCFSAIDRLERIEHRPATLSGPNEPDPWLRLSLVRDLLETGDWYDHEVKRSNAPEGGIASPWTRPLDLVIAGLVHLQPGEASLTVKLMRAACVLPVLWIVLLMLGLMRAVRQLHSAPMSYLMLPVLIGITPLLWSYFGQGNSDHHAPLAALWAWVLAYAIRLAPQPKDNWILGGLLALMLWISPETLPLIAALYLWRLLRWLLDGRGLAGLAHLTLSTALGVAAAVAIERPVAAWLMPIYDSVSIVHVVLFGLCAAIVGVFAGLPTRLVARRYYRLLAAKIGGTMLVLTMAALYPAFFHGPLAEVAPFIHTDFLPRINEARPLFSKPPLYAAHLLVLPLLAIAAYGWMLRVRNPLVARETAAQLLFLQLVTLAMALTQLRWYYYQFPLTALLLAPLIGALFSSGRTWPSRLVDGRNEYFQAAVRIGCISLVMAAPLIFAALNPPRATEQSKRTSICERTARSLLYRGAIQRALGPDPVLLYAPTNLGGEIQFFTPYRIVASNYHREGEGIRYAWGALELTSDARLRAHFAQRGIQAILLCPDARSLPGSVLHGWWDGKAPPAWVTPIPYPGDRAKYAPRLYRVKE